MRVFVTGGSGHIGSAVVPELLSAGHEVVGLARSDGSAAQLQAAGAQVVRGDLDNVELLRDAAASADGAIHLAFKPLRSNDFIAAIATDFAALQAIGAGLADSSEDKPLISTSATMPLSFIGHITDRSASEQDTLDGGPRIDAENAAIALADRGVRVSVIRLAPVVHSTLDTHGFVPSLISIARAKQVSAYVGDGANRWPAVHTADAALLYRVALETAAAGSRLHAVAEPGVRFRHIAEEIGKRLSVPTTSLSAEDAGQHFAHLAPFVGLDNPSSSELTSQWTGWKPTHPRLIEDLAENHYFDKQAA